MQFPPKLRGQGVRRQKRDPHASLVMTAAAISVLAAMPEAVIAAPITSDFTGTVAGNQALTGSHVYTAVGGPNLTAISGSYTHAGSRQPAANDAFTAGGQLVGNNRRYQWPVLTGSAS